MKKFRRKKHKKRKEKLEKTIFSFRIPLSPYDVLGNIPLSEEGSLTLADINAWFDMFAEGVPVYEEV